MIKSLKIVSLTVLFFSCLIIFTPKEKIFNKALNEIYKYDLSFKSYDFYDKAFGAKIDNSNIYYKNIQAITIDKLNIQTMIVSNKIDMQNIKVDDSLKQFIPSTIKHISISYTILNPLFVDIDIYSKQFKIKGYVDIVNSKVVLNITLSKLFKRDYKKIVRQLEYNTKTKDYSYEYQL
jgi:hypothetical protein